MSIFTPAQKRAQPKVHYLQYIRTANTPDEAGDQPAEPATEPTDPENK